MRRTAQPLLFTFALLLAGCDQLGIESATDVAAKREAEGKAIGGACRHVGRSVEACYNNNKKADKAAVFAGWREMNDYMRENKIESMAPPPEPVKPPPVPASAPASEEGEAAKPAKGAKTTKSAKDEH